MESLDIYVSNEESEIVDIKYEPTNLTELSHSSDRKTKPVHWTINTKRFVYTCLQLADLVTFSSLNVT